MHRNLTFAVLLALLLPTLLFARDAREQARIDFLLQRIESARDVKFIRNGSEHDGPAAAAHLRIKLRAVGERIKTAEDFVKYCASESSITHQKYKVRLTNGSTIDAGAYFTNQLRDFEREKK